MRCGAYGEVGLAADSVDGSTSILLAINKSDQAIELGINRVKVVVLASKQIIKNR